MRVWSTFHVIKALFPPESALNPSDCWFLAAVFHAEGSPGCHKWGGRWAAGIQWPGTRGAANRPTVLRAPPTKNHPAPNVRSLEVEKLDSGKKIRKCSGGSWTEEK